MGFINILTNFGIHTVLQNKVIANRFYKLITLIVCLSGLIYQALIIYNQFMSGKTVINLEIGGISNVSLPGVTICFTGVYSMERMAQFNSSYIETNKSYWLNKWVYYESFREYTNIQLKNNGLDLNQLFNNMSIKFKALNGSQLIELELH